MTPPYGNVSANLMCHAAPTPFSEWTFEQDARDTYGRLNGILVGDAYVANGTLILDGQT